LKNGRRYRSAASWGLSAAVGVAFAAACYDSGLDLDAPPPQGGSGGGGSGGATHGDGLPCDVARLLNDACLACHADPPRGGALGALVTRADLMSPAPGDADITRAEDSLARMRDAAAPMPPEGLLPATAVEPLERWIGEGMPEVACGDMLVPPDDPYGTPLVCTSGRFWTDGDEGDEEMRPGHACIACHQDPPKDKDRGKKGEDDDDGGDDDDDDDDIPLYAIAGTVYPSAHEPNDCYGVDDQLVYVLVTDANGTEAVLASNEAGNFFTEAPLVPPFRVRVTRGAEARAMSKPAPHGDCNVCHTEAGSEDAPGRIMSP
jgi:hypothetical protein